MASRARREGWIGLKVSPRLVSPRQIRVAGPVTEGGGRRALRPSLVKGVPGTTAI